MYFNFKCFNYILPQYLSASYVLQLFQDHSSFNLLKDLQWDLSSGTIPSVTSNVPFIIELSLNLNGVLKYFSHFCTARNGHLISSGRSWKEKLASNRCTYQKIRPTSNSLIHTVNVQLRRGIIKRRRPWRYRSSDGRPLKRILSPVFIAHGRSISSKKVELRKAVGCH